MLEQLGLFGSTPAHLFKLWVVNGVMIFSALACFVRSRVVPGKRHAWLLFGCAIGLYAVGQLIWGLWLENLPEPPFPSVSDPFWLAIYPLGFVGLLLIASGRLRSVPSALVLDGVATGLALSAAVAAFEFGPIFHAASSLNGLAGATSLAYPVGDLVLIGLVVGLFAASGWHASRDWVLLGCGLVVLAVADTIYTLALAKGTVVTTVALNAAWTTAFVLIALAGWTPAVAPDIRGVRTAVLPFVAPAVAVAVLAANSVGRISPIGTVLAVAAVLASGVRAGLTLHSLRALVEAQREALTDELTGLSNRRSLMRDLKQAAPGVRRTLVFFDLDGFKAYNDRYGHMEGDLVLARLASRLHAAVRADGRAYRLSGDEFCVLLDDSPDSDDALQRAVRSLSESGEGFNIGSSWGIAHLPDEAATPVEALRLADRRMYAQKNLRPHAAKGQAADLATRMLIEHDAQLHDHSDGVRELAICVTTQLGIAGEELDDIARAAQLHDIGKIAVPSSILDKPGPLDEDEWAHIKRHPLIGERILEAAPALGKVARIVRSTHEHWDGTGYPDGLGGDDIPLAARIIAVCDAHNAMTSHRPYQPALPEREALAEIERCSGTQFDPAVVDAYSRALRAARPWDSPGPKRTVEAVSG